MSARVLDYMTKAKLSTFILDGRWQYRSAIAMAPALQILKLQEDW
jgi:hypothetical protein